MCSDFFFSQWNRGVLHWRKELPSWQRDVVDFLWVFWGLNWQDRLRVVDQSVHLTPLAQMRKLCAANTPFGA